VQRVGYGLKGKNPGAENSAVSKLKEFGAGMLSFIKQSFQVTKYPSCNTISFLDFSGVFFEFEGMASHSVKVQVVHPHKYIHIIFISII